MSRLQASDPPPDAHVLQLPDEVLLLVLRHLPLQTRRAGIPQGLAIACACLCVREGRPRNAQAWQQPC